MALWNKIVCMVCICSVLYCIVLSGIVLYWYRIEFVLYIIVIHLYVYLCVCWYCMSCIVLPTYLPAYLPTYPLNLPTYVPDRPTLPIFLPTYLPTDLPCISVRQWSRRLSFLEPKPLLLLFVCIVLYWTASARWARWTSSVACGPLHLPCMRPWTRLNLGLSSTSGCAAPLPPTRWPRNVFDCSATCTFEHIQQATFSYSTGTAAK